MSGPDDVLIQSGPKELVTYIGTWDLYLKTVFKKKINSHWFPTIINHFSCWPALGVIPQNGHVMAAETDTGNAYPTNALAERFLRFLL